jgi:hypothetical protein
VFRGFAVAGCEPNEMGIGPVFAIPKLLERAGLKIADIGLDLTPPRLRPRQHRPDCRRVHRWRRPGPPHRPDSLRLR